LIKGEDIVKNTTAQRIKWQGHLNRMEDIKLVIKITDWNPTGIRTKERSKNKWSDEVINYLKKLKLSNWIQLVKVEKAGMSWCRRAKPMYGCRVRRRREEEKRRTRRRRRR
jgi:hypothetical protein